MPNSLNRPFSLSLLLAILLPLKLAGAPFALTDSGPGSPGFRERFLASYGVNSAIEPAVGAKERELFEQVAGYLRDDPEQAIRELESGVGDDSHPALQFLLGNLYYQTGAYDRAERMLVRAIEQFPDFRRAHRTLCLIFSQSERHDRAIATWLKVISLGGGDAQSYGLLGYAYLVQEKYESALSAYKMARMFKPDSVDFRRGEAQCLLETGELTRAVALFEELIAENPLAVDYWLLQANAWLRLERYDEAIRNLEIARSLGRQTRESALLLGNLHLRQENYRLALQSYQNALEAPGELRPKSSLQPLKLLVSRGLTGEARSYLASLRAHLAEPFDSEWRTEIALAEARFDVEDGRLEAAAARLEELLGTDPLNGAALLLAGQVYQHRENYEEAEFYLQRLLSIPEKKGDALLALGRLEIARGCLARALRYLHAARELDSRPGLDRYILAVEDALN